MGWYYLNFASEQVTTGKVSQCQKAFEKAFAAARGPRTMALFQRVHDEGGVDLFFTPECDKYAAELLSVWGCTPCDRPSLIGLQLVVGHNEITYYMP